MTTFRWKQAAARAVALCCLLAGCAAAAAPVSFRQGSQSFGVARVFGVAIVDVDADGDNDLFIGNYTGPSRLWLNDGNGVFTDSRQRFEASDAQRAHDVEFGDLNGDSRPDVFLVCHDAPSRVFLNDGAGRLIDSGQDIGSANDAPQSVVLADFDADGDVDACLVYARRPNRLWVNDGGGRFVRTDVGYGGVTSPVMAAADFDGDAVSDYFLGYLQQPGEIRINDGAGGFRDARQAVGDAYGCDGVGCGDVDGDGDVDLVVANIENGVRVWLNRDGAGSFAEAGPYFCPGAIRVVLFDADRDGDLDLITANVGEGNRLWLNDGSGRYASTDRILGSRWAFCFAVGRLDADDDQDVVVGTEFDGAGAGAVYFCERSTVATGGPGARLDYAREDWGELLGDDWGGWQDLWAFTLFGDLY